MSWIDDDAREEAVGKMIASYNEMLLIGFSDQSFSDMLNAFNLTESSRPVKQATSRLAIYLLNVPNHN